MASPAKPGSYGRPAPTRTTGRLVDRDQRTRGGAGSRFADRDQQIGDVLCEHAGVRLAGDRLDIEAEGRAVRQLQVESLQHTHRAQDRPLCLLRGGAVHVEQRFAEAGDQQDGEAPGLRCLDEDHAEAVGGRDASEAVEEDGFSDAAQPDRHQALAWPAGSRAPDRDPERVGEAVATDERRGWRPSTRPERVPQGKLTKLT